MKKIIFNTYLSNFIALIGLSCFIVAFVNVEYNTVYSLIAYLCVFYTLAYQFLVLKNKINFK
jgi:hypothetical protein